MRPIDLRNRNLLATLNQIVGTRLFWGTLSQLVYWGTLSQLVPFADNAGLGDRMLISRCVVY